MNQEKLYKTIIAPHVSEKATIMTEKRNTYVFQVATCATKASIKEAIEFLFKTQVKSVQIINVRPKKKIFRGLEGKRRGWKKAYVTLFGDQKLDMMGGQ